MSRADRQIIGKESNSVLNQRKLLHNYLNRRREFSLCERVEYCDDGYTGTNLNRPHLQEMLQSIIAGEIQILMIKDLSRLGRNHLQVGRWLQELDAIGVRVIAVGDAYDSGKDSCTNSLKQNGLQELELGIRNLCNEYYSKELSLRIKNAIIAKQKTGQYISAYPIFGYKKSKEDKHKLVLDPEPSAIVKEIFVLASDGYIAREIAEKLNQKGIKTPAWYRLQSGERNYPVQTAYTWNSNQVRKILNDLRYTGDMVANQRVRNGVGQSKTQAVSKENQIIVENTHEGIVSKEIYSKIKERKRLGPN